MTCNFISFFSFHLRPRLCVTLSNSVDAAQWMHLQKMWLANWWWARVCNKYILRSTYIMYWQRRNIECFQPTQFIHSSIVWPFITCPHWLLLLLWTINFCSNMQCGSVNCIATSVGCRQRATTNGKVHWKMTVKQIK